MCYIESKIEVGGDNLDCVVRDRSSFTLEMILSLFLNYK